MKYKDRPKIKMKAQRAKQAKISLFTCIVILVLIGIIRAVIS